MGLNLGQQSREQMKLRITKQDMRHGQQAAGINPGGLYLTFRRVRGLFESREMQIVRSDCSLHAS